MNVNNFNSALSLPRLFESTGRTGYNYVKLPHFGWYAYNKDLSDIRNSVDSLFSEIEKDNEKIEYISDLIRNKKHLFDFHITWSEMTTMRIFNHAQLLHRLRQLLVAAQTELFEGQAYLNGEYLNLSEQLRSLGLKALFNTGIGLITDRVIRAFVQYIHFPANIKNKLVLPSYCTPKHACSYETLEIKERLNARNSLYVNDEKGWYGNFDSTFLVSDIQKLATMNGLTWDYKLDYWANRQLDLDPAISVADCIKLWVQAKNARFTTSPLSVIEQSGELDKLKYHLKTVSITQLEELEKRFKINLFDSWKAQKSEEVEIGKLRFVKKDNQYWVLTGNGRLEEFTNFAVEIHRIFKHKGRFCRSGAILFGNREVPFQLDNWVFMQPSSLITAINELCLESGVGLPLVLTNYSRYLLDVVNRTNRNAPIG